MCGRASAPAAANSLLSVCSTGQRHSYAALSTEPELTRYRRPRTTPGGNPLAVLARDTVGMALRRSDPVERGRAGIRSPGPPPRARHRIAGGPARDLAAGDPPTAVSVTQPHTEPGPRAGSEATQSRVPPRESVSVGECSTFSGRDIGSAASHTHRGRGRGRVAEQAIQAGPAPRGRGGRVAREGTRPPPHEVPQGHRAARHRCARRRGPQKLAEEPARSPDHPTINVLPSY